MIPTTHNVQRIGYKRDLVRIVSVDLYENRACKGNGPLHLARGVRFKDGEPCNWYVTHSEAQKFGWV